MTAVGFPKRTLVAGEAPSTYPGGTFWVECPVGTHGRDSL